MSGATGVQPELGFTRDPYDSTGARARSQLGVYVYLASDLMLFASFFAAYYLLRAGAPDWPPTGVDLDVARAFAATVVLVTSSFTLIAGDRALANGSVKAMRRWILVTVALGGLFLVNQFLEYASLPFSASDSAYGSIYWLLTGLHTLHVIAGVLILLAVVARVPRVENPHDLHTWAAGASAFWHLVDVVWIGVFLTIWVVQ